MAIKIGHASIDENGKTTGGTAGDQTGKEVVVRTWYNGSWHTVLRPKSSTLAEKSAAACEAACANNKIGYDQYGRNTLYKQAKTVNFDLSKITTACECDCSSLMHVCAMAGGANLTYGSTAFRTATMVNELVATGDYEKLTDSKYLTSDAYLKRGDILVKSGHTVMALENGSSSNITTTTTKGVSTVNITLNVLKTGSKGDQVKALQHILHDMGYDLGTSPTDGIFGSKTAAAVRKFQTANKLTADGIVGANTWKKLLGV